MAATTEEVPDASDPAWARASAPSGKWQLRYYDADGKRHTGGRFASKSAAMQHYRDAIEPRLTGEPVRRDAVTTFSELVDVYLARYGRIRSASTVRTLRHRLARPLAVYGAVTLSELEGMGGDIAGFRGTLPDRLAHDVM